MKNSPACLGRLFIIFSKVLCYIKIYITQNEDFPETSLPDSAQTLANLRSQVPSNASQCLWFQVNGEYWNYPSLAQKDIRSHSSILSQINQSYIQHRHEIRSTENVIVKMDPLFSLYINSHWCPGNGRRNVQTLAEPKVAQAWQWMDSSFVRTSR